MIKKIVLRLIPSSIKKQAENFVILSKIYGQYRSIRNSSSINERGEPIPWYTYPAIEFLNQFDFSDKKVFEFGSGNSSLYWSERCLSLISIEHDQDWFNKTKNNIRSNQRLFLRNNKDEYVKSINEFESEFDIIIIDGLYRQDCAKEIKNLNRESGIVILDNSDWYAETAKFLRDSMDMIQTDFHGFGQINNYTWTTSLFLTRGVTMNPKNKIQPAYSLSALRYKYEH
jgi:predicted O-methyltransferase YrrM